MASRRAGAHALAALFAALLLVPAGAGARTVIRVGSLSDPDDPKVAIVGSDRRLDNRPFAVYTAGGDQRIGRGRLMRAPGDPAPFAHAYRAKVTTATTCCAYRIGIGKRVRSGRLNVQDGAANFQIDSILRFFAANRDGAEPSPLHAPAHLNDAVIHPGAPAHGGAPIAISGGWMDAGDMLHFTQTTAFATAMLEAAARIDPARAAALGAEADVGARWLLAAHPFPDAFVAQVGDERDHELDFRDPAADDALAAPGIGSRFAYTLAPNRIGGDLGGKAAAALAMAYRRTGFEPYLAAAREWYDAGVLSGAPAPPLARAGYPKYADGFYVAERWRDSLATGALELYRATGEGPYLDDYGRYIRSRDAVAEGTIGVVDGFGQLGAADACGNLGLPPIPGGPALDRSCSLIGADGRIAARSARSNAFGMGGIL